MSQKTMQLLKQAIPVFDMLKDEKRQEILMLLFEQGATSVNKITEQVSLSRPAVSHHLKLLSQAGLVFATKHGKERYYELQLGDTIEHLRNLLESLENDVKDK